MPIEVQAERPPSTAVTEQPLPRCATTSAKSVSRRARAAPRRALTAHSTDSPWNPKRRSPCGRNPGVRQRIRELGRWQRRVERGVEGGRLGHPGECHERRPDRLDRDRIVERGEVGEPVQLIEHLVVDECRGREPRPAVDDPMTDRLDRADRDALDHEAFEKRSRSRPRGPRHGSRRHPTRASSRTADPGCRRRARSP